MRILFVPGGGPHVPPSRIRVYDYLAFFEKAGVQTKVQPWRFNLSARETILAFEQLCEVASDYDVIYLQRVLLKIGQIEKLRRRASCIIFDFDDALFFVPSIQWPSSGRVTLFERAKQCYRLLARGGRFYSSRKSSLDSTLSCVDGIVAGNKALADYAGSFNRRICIVPTPIDIDRIPAKDEHNTSPLIIGWVGTPDGVRFVESIAKALRIVSEKYRDKILIRLCTAPTSIDLKGVCWERVPWQLEYESTILKDFNIGIMPLTDDGWASGKCAYKALLYMATGIPSVLSPIGMNRTVVTEGVTGFLAKSNDEWVEKLSLLIESAELRKSMGSASRRVVKQDFDRPIVFSSLLEFVQKLVCR